MRILKRLLWGTIIVAFLAAGIAYRANAQTPGTQYFAETNHNVSGEFLSFYRSVQEPFVALGYPITEAEDDPVTHYLVQYFQYGRLELHPEAPAGQRVSLSNLGELLYTPGAPLADVPHDGPTCRNFSETGKSVCYIFRQFYDAHNGQVYFGNPISWVEIEDGRYVQYFERARMEWRPEAPAGQHVGLSELGRRYYDLVQRGTPSEPGRNAPKVSPVRLQVRAFVARSLIPADSQQTLYIVVQDQALNPVAQATTGVEVTFPDGRKETYRPPVTNADGISVFSFNVGQASVKQVIQLEVVAATPELEQHTSTWFRIWW